MQPTTHENYTIFQYYSDLNNVKAIWYSWMQMREQYIIELTDIAFDSYPISFRGQGFIEQNLLQMWGVLGMCLKRMSHNNQIIFVHTNFRIQMHSAHSPLFNFGNSIVYDGVTCPAHFRSILLAQRKWLSNAI